MSTPTATAAAIMQLYRQHGHLAYGEGMSQLSHATQAGLLARERGYDDEIILAAFLHDVGHLSPLLTPAREAERMGELGVQHHDRVGEDFLRERGCGERLLAAVRNHVAAKRYLCYAEPGYYDRLSEASKGTLAYQGGPMTAAEAEAFAANLHFDISLRVRRLDEAAKEADFPVTEDHLSYFTALLTEYLVQRA
ncbi:MAG: HD domain-containing protein [Bacteroidota bacterium]